MTAESGKKRQLSNWLSSFEEYLEGASAPKIYKRWAGIAAVAGALERRCFTLTSAALQPIFPNQWILLVGPPGVGKTAVIEPVFQQWIAARTLFVAPTSMTHKGYIDTLQASGRQMMLPDRYEEFHCLLIAASEFGNFVPAHDLAFLNTLNFIWDNPDVYEERKRMDKEMIQIIKPSITQIGGAQPAFLASLLPEEAWEQGTMSRTLLVFSADVHEVEMFDDEDDIFDDQVSAPKSFGARQGLRKALHHDIKMISDMMGRFRWSREAKHAYKHWLKNSEGFKNQPKLNHYNTRRKIHLVKIIMACSAATNQDKTVAPEHVEMGIDYLTEAEDAMPMVFESMISNPHNKVLEETVMRMLAEYHATRSDIPMTVVSNWMGRQVPPWALEALLRQMETSGYVDVVGVVETGSGHKVKMLKPRPREKWGVPRELEKKT